MSGWSFGVNEDSWKTSWIRRVAKAGWSTGMAANELDLDHSTLWQHSRRMGVKMVGPRPVTEGRPHPWSDRARQLRAQIQGEKRKLEDPADRGEG
jgi:hypothetical protein